MDIRANRSVAPLALGPGVLGASAAKQSTGPTSSTFTNPSCPSLPGEDSSAGGRVVATFHADPSAVVRFAYRAAAPFLRRVIDRADVVTVVSPVAGSAIRPLGRGLRRDSQRRRPSRDHAKATVAHDVWCSWAGTNPAKVWTCSDGLASVRSRVPDAELVVMGATRNRLPDGVTALGNRGSRAEVGGPLVGGGDVRPQSRGREFRDHPGGSDGGRMRGGGLGSGSLRPRARRDGSTLSSRRCEPPWSTILVGLLEDPAGTAALGDAKAGRAGRFSWQRVLDAMRRSTVRRRFRLAVRPPTGLPFRAYIHPPRTYREAA